MIKFKMMTHVGSLVGIADGFCDGSAVGSSDGKIVGTADGSIDGDAVGVSDGARLGLDEGLDDGAPVGAKDGLIDGLDDGLRSRISVRTLPPGAPTQRSWPDGAHQARACCRS